MGLASPSVMVLASPSVRVSLVDFLVYVIAVISLGDIPAASLATTSLVAVSLAPTISDD